MVDKIFGQEFPNESNPTGTMLISVNNGSVLVDVELQNLYKALGSPATQALLDLISTTQGVILYYNGTDWVALATGTAGQVLQTGGASANPSWVNGWSNRIADGRLTLETGVPVSVSDQSAKTTVYYTPYIGNRIALYDGAKWVLRTFTERSVAVPSTTNTPFDIFAYDNAGTVTLETVNWTNDTTRATALTYQDGVLSKSGATTRRYLGTGRTTGVSGQCEDSAGGGHQSGGKRFLWNYYNRVPRSNSVKDTTNNWSYLTDTTRQANGASGNKCEFVVGVGEDMVQADVMGVIYSESNTARGFRVGIGVDSTTAFSGLVGAGYNTSASPAYAGVTGFWRGIPAAGYHYIAWLEKGADTGTALCLGDNGETGIQAGLAIVLWN